MSPSAEQFARFLANEENCATKPARIDIEQDCPRVIALKMIQYPELKKIWEKKELSDQQQLKFKLALVMYNA